MTEYFESKSKVLAFKLPYSFELEGQQYKAGEYVVIKNGKAKVISYAEFSKKYEEKTVKTLKFPAFDPPGFKLPEDFPKPLQPQYDRIWFGDPPYPDVTIMNRLNDKPSGELTCSILSEGYDLYD